MIIYIRSDRTQSVKAPDISGISDLGRRQNVSESDRELPLRWTHIRGGSKRLLDMEWWKLFQQFADLEIDIELLFDEDIPAEL